ncbi:protein of unknown function [Brevefilum fermentans]|uniref:Uncharacterized protein n=1 Tax=Candidatus Brevifilum fermentans TaxID=1986204 RepID=A0A1Y6K680_9CHLR|nr:protein of unknown function [Brevefilum fermentans]
MAIEKETTLEIEHQSIDTGKYKRKLFSE